MTADKNNGWVDATYYGVGERGKIEPRIWQVSKIPFTLEIIKDVNYDDEWTLWCPVLGARYKPLHTRDVCEAAVAALVHAANLIHDRRAELNQAEQRIYELMPMDND